MAPMDRYAINKCSLAYIFYLVIALLLFLTAVATSGALNPDTAAAWQTLIAMWMIGLAPTAVPAALLLSLLLWRHWLSEWGVIALPLLLVLWIGLIAYEEAQSGTYYWLNIVAIAYVILAVAFAARWFLYGRMRAAELAEPTRDSSKAAAGRGLVPTGLALVSGLIAALFMVAPGQRIAGPRRDPRDSDGDSQPDGPD